MYRRLVGIAAAAVLLVNATIQPASAARPHGTTICVDPDDDACVPGIHFALDQAVDGDIINISARTYYENVTINKNVTLVGTQSAQFPGFRTTLRPTVGSHSSVVHIMPGKTVTLRMLRITGGSVGTPSSSPGGGGIWNEGLLTADTVVVDRNTVDKYEGEGGGIYSTGSLSIVNSHVDYNTANASDGGGISSSGYLVIENSFVDHNSAYRQSDPNLSWQHGGHGGGIYSRDSGADLAGTSVSDNFASNAGGAILASGSTVTMFNSTVHHNRAEFSAGGVFAGSNSYTKGFYQGVLHLTRVTIDHNYATGCGVCGAPGEYQGNGQAGGLFASDSEVVLKNVTLSGNMAATAGGAIGIDVLGHPEFGSTTIYESTIAHNISLSGEGGGIANVGDPEDPVTVTIEGSVLANNHGGNCRLVDAGVLQSWDFNVSDDATCDLPYHADVINTDPMLNPLALNAPGSIETHALQIGSPAIDRADVCSVQDDARGVARDSLCDSGAYEGSEEPKADLTRVLVKVNATCRLGPGTQYAATGYMSAGDEHDVTGRNEAGTWLRLEDCWVSRTLLQVDVDVLSISVAAAPPLPTVPAAVCKPTMGPSECEAAGGKWVAGIPGVSKGSCNCP